MHRSEKDYRIISKTLWHPVDNNESHYIQIKKTCGTGEQSINDLWVACSAECLTSSKNMLPKKKQNEKASLTSAKHILNQNLKQTIHGLKRKQWKVLQVVVTSKSGVKLAQNQKKKKKKNSQSNFMVAVWSSGSIVLLQHKWFVKINGTINSALFQKNPKGEYSGISLSL